MEEKIENGVSLVLTLAKIESDYFLDIADRHEIRLVIKQIDFNFEKRGPNYNKERDAKSMISLFLILERFKKQLIFENFVLNFVESEINVFASNLDLLASDLYEHENNRNGIHKNASSASIQNNLLCKRPESYMFSQQRIKNKRANYPKKISRILKNWLKENMNNPYPSESEKAMLMELTGLDVTQINNWFINARRRILPYMKSKYIKYE
ncbi:uncharacterized protein VICG_02118 [Vittaforma corneae ATCC 50505]|uniref:Homeobox domain-containing protein n=1 Tax=Vittaforma corneae (strain ATCC 50505) TaxID=993615 RepID=L2GJN6_VITCO|nr:uncharacterized protein VICG_02118 [Vittaforma corneae ATCC 50505]ELA40844.1 hypothetical protein VICG_02118 [Vittaforma corneae ATCC 50505]